MVVTESTPAGVVPPHMENLTHQIPVGIGDGSPSDGITNWFYPEWYRDAYLNNGRPVFSTAIECGNVEEHRDAMVKCLEKQGLTLRSESFGGKKRRTNGIQMVSQDHSVMVNLWSHSYGAHNGAMIYARSKEDCLRMEEAFKEFGVETPAKTLKAIVSRHGNFALQDMHLGGKTLEPDNYVPTVVEGYQKMLRGLSGERPKGRLAIMSGPPLKKPNWR